MPDLAETDYDVVVAGAGLPGLSLAAALARAGVRVVLADGAPIAAPAFDAAQYDVRVYAISPGSAQFLHGIGAWQRLPVERLITSHIALDQVNAGMEALARGDAIRQIIDFA